MADTLSVMLTFKILAFSKGAPDWLETGYLDYVKRLKPYLKIDYVALPPSIRPIPALTTVILPKDYVVALAIEGEAWSSIQLANYVNQWQQVHARVVFLIGGPTGLPPAWQACAHKLWSLSALTFPHILVRVLVLEQLYRAITLNHHHPYHKG
jgi:23S rRNA (pseudouridine1915-N3)-methyltransferase